MSRSHIEIGSGISSGISFRAALLGTLALGVTTIGACSQATAARSSRDERITEVSAATVPANPQSSELFRYRSDVQANDVPLNAPVDAAWQRVSRAYAALKLPVTTIDSAHHVIGAQNAAVRNRVAGARVSQWLSCGYTPIGSPRADSYVVYLTMLTEVRPTGATSDARTIVTGTAEPADGTSSGVQCSSTGELERRLRETLSAP